MTSDPSTSHSSHRHTAIYLELRVSDLDLAREFYTQLGFTEVWRDPRPGTQYLVMELDGTPLALRLHEHAHAYFADMPDGRLGWGVELVVSVDDVDEVYKRALTTDRVVAELRAQPWGLRDFRIADPFGYYLRITEPSNLFSDDYGGRPVSPLLA